MVEKGLVMCANAQQHSKTYARRGFQGVNDTEQQK